MLGFFARLKSTFLNLRRSQGERPDRGLFFGRTKSLAGVSVTHETALNYAAVWGCVRVIAESIAQMSWHVMSLDRDGGKTYQSRHPANWLLLNQANPEMSAFTFRETLLAWALLWGNGYAEIERNMSGGALWLWPISPDRVNPDRTSSGALFYDVANRGNSNVAVPAQDMLHIRGLGFDGTMGYSVVAMARQSLGLGLALDSFASTYFGNGAHPKGAIKYPGKLTEEAKKNIRNSFDELYGGVNSNRTAVFDNGMEFQQFTIPPNDSQFLESRKFQVQEICRWFRVPPHKLADLERATFCLPADVQVFTEFGPKSIADIAVGEKIWSQDPVGKWELRQVERSECTGDDEILTIRCRNRTLRCTASHRVAVRQVYDIPYQGGGGKYTVIAGKAYRKSYRTVYRPAGELQPGDFLVGANALPDGGSTSCPTREQVSVEFMEVLGMLVGDGFFARNAKTQSGSTFGISHGEHDSYLPHYIAAVEKEFRQYSGPYGRKNGEEKPLRAARRDKNTTVFYSSLAYDELDQLGIIGTAKTKRVPEWIFGLTRELKLAFLRGYLDADGTVNTAGQIRYVSVNKELLEDVRHLCVSVGVQVGNLFSHQIASVFNGTPYTHVLHGFICSDIENNMEIGSHTDFYNTRFIERFDSIQKRYCVIYPYEQKRNDCGEGAFATRITSIERSIEKEPVYDLCVSGNHSFIANLLLVHNSNIEHQAIEFVVDTLVPWCVRLEQETDMKLFGQNRGNLFTKLNVNALLRGDLASRYSAYRTGIDGGWLSINDVRRLEDMNPLPEEVGDVYRRPLNTQFVTEDGEILSPDQIEPPHDPTPDPIAPEPDHPESRRNGALH